jgi:putative Mg2+ transporter-C (MgtC) family protein
MTAWIGSQMIIKLLLASLLGGLIGLEREVHGRPAGFRTHLLVALGSCLFVISSIHFYELYGNRGGSGPLGVDPSRIAAQVVTGIGFLGAGAIIREGASIRGLTTAACLWVAAAIGLACGAGLFLVSFLVTCLALLSLLLLKKVEYRLRRDVYLAVKIWSDEGKDQLATISGLLEASRMEIVKVSLERDLEKRELQLEYSVRSSDPGQSFELIDQLAAVPGVKRVRLE